MTLQESASEAAQTKVKPEVKPGAKTDSPYLTVEDLKFLDEAALFFADPGKIAKGLAWAGKPVETLQDRLPEKARLTIAVITQKAIEKALVAAVRTLPDRGTSHSDDADDREAESLKSSRLHRGLTTMTGAAAGLIGLPALAFELPLTTVLIMRAISDQARLFGHDLEDLETRLECLLVFTMGVGESAITSASAGGAASKGAPPDSVAQYFLTRASFVGTMREAVSVLGAFTTKGLAASIERGSAPLFAKLTASIVEKFQVRVSQKFVAESIPLLGAVGGGALNYAFTDFFVRAARYHFGIRALEKKHGEQIIKDYLDSVRVRDTSVTN